MAEAGNYNLAENADLYPYNTFWIKARADYLAKIQTVDGAYQLFRDFEFRNRPHLMLGDGSNILLTGDYHGLVILNEITGKEVIEENEAYVTLKIYAGENWHRLVEYAVEENWGGIENLSLIPGKVGAAPIQNIGAYGAELKDVFVALEALNLDTLSLETFSSKDCEFGYRHSVFKGRLKDQYLIVSVTLKLAKNPVLNTSYGALQKAIAEKGLNNPSIKDISLLVSEIRRSKLPYPDELGNSGSFFKNPIVNYEPFQKLQSQFPEMPFYQLGGDKVKIPAGWLIEQAGMKGYREGQVGTHQKQALVIVNYGGATGKEVYDFSMRVKEKVYQKFDIDLQPEVNII